MVSFEAGTAGSPGWISRVLADLEHGPFVFVVNAPDKSFVLES
jgi:hypothetical protein